MVFGALDSISNIAFCKYHCQIKDQSREGKQDCMILETLTHEGLLEKLKLILKGKKWEKKYESLTFGALSHRRENKLIYSFLCCGANRQTSPSCEEYGTTLQRLDVEPAVFQSREHPTMRSVQKLENYVLQIL